MNTYIISSERAYRREDEAHNYFKTGKVLKVGDVITLDGIRWVVEEIVQ